MTHQEQTEIERLEEQGHPPEEAQMIVRVLEQ